MVKYTYIHILAINLLKSIVRKGDIIQEKATNRYVLRELGSLRGRSVGMSSRCYSKKRVAFVSFHFVGISQRVQLHLERVQTSAKYAAAEARGVAQRSPTVTRKIAVREDSKMTRARARYCGLPIHVAGRNM